MFTEDPITTAAAAAAAAVSLRLVYTQLTSPLKDIPGPFLAKFTDAWRFLDYWQTTQIQSHLDLHEKHGPAVRIGPNMVSLGDPKLLKTVYSTRGDFLKTDFYEVADAVANGQRIENVFSTRSNYFHSRYLKPYQKFFSINTVLGKEYLADKMVISLCDQLETRFANGANAGKVADLADWIEFCAWDLDWEMTFSENLGFLTTGTDVDGMIHTGEMIMRYLGCVGQMPWLDKLLGKNKYCPVKFATFEHAAAYSYQRVMERAATRGKTVKKDRQDFLDNFLDAKEQYPDIVSDNEVVSYLMMNVLAGADTTALVQKAIAWNILSHPSVHEKLVVELDAAGLSFPAKYEETKDLPYLNVVIKEGMRMHPVISGILERYVPAGGLTLPDGRILPAGTKVGINPWVSSRNKEVFGEDAEVFRPERWLQTDDETDEEFAARTKLMKDCDFTFGGGNRICVGRNMATVELHKITATLFSRYDLKLATGVKQWSPRWWWFTFTDHIRVTVNKREGHV